MPKLLPPAPPPPPAHAPAAPVEVELRLQVPPAARAAVRQALGLDRPRGVAAPADLRRTRLQALYLDTPQRTLAAAKLALRLRKEGRHWVQTVKGGAAHALVRGEHNHRLPPLPAGRSPSCDPRHHAGTAVGEALLAELDQAARRHGPDGAGLVERFRTDITRHARPLRLRHGTVELSLDEGEIRAPDGTGGWRRWPVSELEIELLSGSPRAVLEAARRWTAQGLWLELRSKAERGERLARGGAWDQPGRAIPAEPVDLPPGADPAGAWAAMLDNIAAQVLRNAAEIAGGAPAPEHVHQLRVGLRRLRSAQKLVAGWPGVAPLAAAPGLAQLFRALGAVRDADALAADLGPALQAAWQGLGLPSPEVLPPPLATPLRAPGAPPGPGVDPAGATVPAAAPGAVPLLRAPATQQALLLLYAESALPPALVAPMLRAWAPPPAPDGGDRVAARAPAAPVGEAPGPAALAHGTPASDAVPRAAPGEQPPAGTRRLATARLARWQHRLRRAAREAEQLDDEARHALRKALKRQRYALECCAPLLGRKALKAYLGPLRAAQEALGRFNDVCVATAAARARAQAGEAPAWFALGWLAQQRERVLAEVARALRRFRRAPPPWR